MKKFLMLLLVVLGATLVSCGKDEASDPTPEQPAPTEPSGNHEHNPAIEWSYDDESHFHACSCGEKFDVTPHELTVTQTKEPTATEEGEETLTCDCGYSKVRKTEKLPAANTVERYRADDRDAKFVIYEADGSEVEAFSSLYAAIVYCVDNCDIDAYIIEAGTIEVTEETKLFVNASQFSQSTKDMFWYYSAGTTKSRYEAWASTYWQDAYGKDEITVLKDYASQQVVPYANGYELVGIGADPAAQSTPVWTSCWYLEASTTVNLVAYSGITKAEYEIKLSEAEIYPPYENSDDTWAYVGFVTADAYNVSHQGLRCDTATGNWYYYSGEVSYDKNEIEIDESKCLLTSTWDEEKGCYRPNADVKLTMELVTTEDEFIVHRLTIELSTGLKYVYDYEIADLTMCGTIRFTTGLDIVSENTFPDYMNGSKFENVVITKGVGHFLEEIYNDWDLYNNIPELEAPGEYDLLNSNPASAARFHTVIYTPSCVEYDYSTAGKDVYSFSFDFK